MRESTSGILMETFVPPPPLESVFGDQLEGRAFLSVLFLPHAADGVASWQCKHGMTDCDSEDIAVTGRC